MYMFLLMAGPSQQGAQGQSPNFLVSMLPFLIIMVLFYFLLIRPKQQEQKKHESMLKSLKKGDRVLTSGGLYGSVVGIRENIIVLKIADNVKAEFQIQAVQAVVGKES